MKALTLASLQPLFEQFQGEGLVLSCYADLSVIPGTPSRWPGVFKAQATAVKKMLADNPSAWEQFEKDFQAIGKIVDTPAAPPCPRDRGVQHFATQLLPVLSPRRGGR